LSLDQPQTLLELSVVLPVRNEEAHLGLVLEQLSEQSLPAEKYEILVVDGISDDGTCDVVRAAAAKYGNIKLLENPKHRSGPARNVGANAAMGKYLLFVDGHCDIPDQDMLSSVLEAFTAGEKCVSRPQPLLDKQATDYGKAVALARKSWLGHQTGSKIYQKKDRHCNPLSAGCGYTVALYRELGGIDEDFDAGEDLEFNLRVHRSGIKALHSHNFTVGYYPRSSFRALFRQIYRYGYGRARMAHKHQATFSPISFGLGIFGLSLVLLPLLAIIWTPALWLWTLIVAGYTTVTGLTSFWQSRSVGMKSAVFVWSTFPAIHLGAGWGYLSGLLGGPSWCHRAD
jgi:succinoglycan biosynthesis protein ExoA